MRIKRQNFVGRRQRFTVGEVLVRKIDPVAPIYLVAYTALPPSAPNFFTPLFLHETVVMSAFKLE